MNGVNALGLTIVLPIPGAENETVGVKVDRFSASNSSSGVDQVKAEPSQTIFLLGC